jgi:hypothetical protein
MPKSLRCPGCGTQAVDRGEPIEPDGWYEPFCPTCRKPLTPEGLLIDIEQAGSERFIKEIGKVRRLFGNTCAQGDRSVSRNAKTR